MPHVTHRPRLGRSKLWLWALPARRCVYIDLDMLVLKNLDTLMHAGAGGSAGSVGGAALMAPAACKVRSGTTFFNSGLLVLTPSLDTLGRLLELARFTRHPWNGRVPAAVGAQATWPQVCSPANDPLAANRLFPNASGRALDGTSAALLACRRAHGGLKAWRMLKACESKFTDQSILNYAFGYPCDSPRCWPHLQRAGRTACACTAREKERGLSLLPPDFSRHDVGATDLELRAASVVHFVGEPKPWNPTQRRRRGAPAMTSLWKRVCTSKRAARRD